MTLLLSEIWKHNGVKIPIVLDVYFMVVGSSVVFVTGAGVPEVSRASSSVI